MRKLLLIICAMLAFNAIAQENYGKLSISGYVQTEVEDATSFQADYSYNEFINNNVYVSCGAGVIYSALWNTTIGLPSANSLSICAPINLGYRMKLENTGEFNIYTGVQPTLLLFGYNYDKRYDEVYKEDINPFGISYNIGVSVRAMKKFGVFVEYNHALTIPTFGIYGNGVSNALKLGFFFTFE